MMVRAEDILEQAARWCAEGYQVAIATVIETWGSAPRPVGSQLVINDQRQFAGSVSGGCIEGAVVGEAIKIINGDDLKTIEFSVSDEQALSVGLTCGGSVKVFITSIDPGGILTDLSRAIVGRIPLSIITDLTTGEQSMVTDTTPQSADLSETLLEAARTAFTTRTCSLFNDDGAALFIHALPPAPRIFVVGAGHIAQALAPMAGIAGFDVTVIDPRQAFITRERFPDTVLADVWPDEFFGDHQPDSSTAIVALVHDPKIDDPALEIAVRSRAFYIGALGSTSTHGKRIERFITNGFSEAELSRIQAPIGLPIGGRKPPEIAVSILAQIVEHWCRQTK